MKTTVVLRLLYTNFEDRWIIEEFRRLFPFGIYHAGFQVEVPPEDPRLKLVLAELERRRIPLEDYKGPAKKPRPRFQYTLEHSRHYDDSDWDSARYLWLKHEVLLSEEQERDEQRRLKLPAARMTPDVRIGCVLWDCTVVRDTVRRAILEASLIGARFTEVVLVGPTIGASFWELNSSVILPPMPRECVVRHQDSPDDDLHVAGIFDGDYFPKEIHYAADALRAVGPFDFAETHEIFCGPGWKQSGQGERRLIVSQAFRQFCLAQGLNVSWHSPVRIDPVPALAAAGPGKA